MDETLENSATAARADVLPLLPDTQVHRYIKKKEHGNREQVHKEKGTWEQGT
jgi:hypothetical protein